VGPTAVLPFVTKAGLTPRAEVGVAA
jgi:hypothetical protein